MLTTSSADQCFILHDLAIATVLIRSEAIRRNRVFRVHIASLPIATRKSAIQFGRFLAFPVFTSLPPFPDLWPQNPFVAILRPS